tara:strand:- start:3027 stop:3179 length:153 start_codon:yes stop_codon:yes gene_type:complete
MNFEAFLFVVAPLILFITGVLLIPFIFKPKYKEKSESYKLIDDLEKKYIY